MLTLNKLYEELKEVPVDKLEELYLIIQAYSSKYKMDRTNAHKILTFAGCFNEMSQQDFDEFVQETKKTRQELFNRNPDL